MGVSLFVSPRCLTHLTRGSYSPLGCSQRKLSPHIGPFRRLISTTIAQLRGTLTGTNGFIQDLVPVVDSLKQAKAKAFEDVSRLVPTHFLS